MKCANCGNENEKTLQKKEDNTIYCSCCSHITKIEEGLEKISSCPKIQEDESIQENNTFWKVVAFIGGASSLGFGLIALYFMGKSSNSEKQKENMSNMIKKLINENAQKDDLVRWWKSEALRNGSKKAGKAMVAMRGK